MKQIPNYKLSVSMNEVVVKNKTGWDYREQIKRGFNPADNNCEWVTFACYKLSGRNDMFKFQTFLRRIKDQNIYLENDSVKPTIEKTFNNLGLNLTPIKVERLDEIDKKNKTKKFLWGVLVVLVLVGSLVLIGSGV